MELEVLSIAPITLDSPLMEFILTPWASNVQVKEVGSMRTYFPLFRIRQFKCLAEMECIILEVIILKDSLIFPMLLMR
jgi:hypothetical protein